MFDKIKSLYEPK